MADDPGSTKPDPCSLDEADWVSATEVGEHIAQINHGAWMLAPGDIRDAILGGCDAVLELEQDGQKNYGIPPPGFWLPLDRLRWVNGLNPSMQRGDYPDRPWPWELRAYLPPSELWEFRHKQRRRRSVRSRVPLAREQVSTLRVFLRRAEAVQWGLLPALKSPQAMASEEPPPPREQPGESTVGAAGGETAPAPASVADASAPVANTEALAAEFVADEEAAPAPAGAPAPVQSGPEAQPKPDKQSDEPTDPAGLTDLIFRELTGMPHAHFKNGCLLQDLIEYLFEAVPLEKDAAGLPRAELFKSIFKGIARAALAGHYTPTGHPDDPSGQARPIPPATLPSFLFDEWDRSRLSVDGPGTIWHGVTVWRSEVEAPDTVSDLGEPTPEVASTDAEQPYQPQTIERFRRDASAPVANTEALAAEPEVASPPAVDAMTTEPPQQIRRMSSTEQSQWLKTALADNPPDREEPLTPEGYGKRIAEMGMPLGAMHKPSSIIARYYQLNPRDPRRRKPRRRKPQK